MMRRLNNHPNIIELFGFGIQENLRHYIVMEFMEDGTLASGIHKYYYAALLANEPL